MDSTTVLIVLNFLLVCITAIYAGLTHRISKANEKAVAVMKEQSEAFYRPYLTVTHELNHESFIYLLIKNTGKTNAENLKLSIDKNFYQLDKHSEEYNIINLPAFTNQIESFPPGAEITLFLLHGALLEKATPNDPETPTVFKITATYSYAGKTVIERTTVDLRPYRNTFLKSGAIEKEISKLREKLNEIKELLVKKS